jgi:hypothetical protein
MANGDGHLTLEQAKALAGFLVSLRPDWDQPGVTTLLWNGRDRAPVRDLACAAVGAATALNHEGAYVARLPSVIDQPGQHWRHKTADIRPGFDRPDDNQRCAVCYLGYNDCRRIWRGNHDFVSLADHRKEAAETDPTGYVADARAALHDTTDSQEVTDVEPA